MVELNSLFDMWYLRVKQDCSPYPRLYNLDFVFKHDNYYND